MHVPTLSILCLAVAAAVPGVGVGSAFCQDEPASPAVEPLGPQFEAERNVRKIFAEFFRRNRNAMTRERGWEELAAYMHDDRLYPLILELFERQPLEVRNELADHFAEHAGVHAQTMLAWIAVFETRDMAHRDYASATLAGLIGDGTPDTGAQSVFALGLKSDNDEHVNAAAALVRTYNLLRAVPLLAQAQLQPRGGGGGEVRTGAIAQIVVGTQQAFVADLTPVVATSAVGFQPTIGVVSSGTVLRVMDAVVYEYRTNVHSTLVAMTTAATGSPTGHLGYDAEAWIDWYARELEPMLDAAEDAGG